MEAPDLGPILTFNATPSVTDNEAETLGSLAHGTRFLVPPRCPLVSAWSRVCRGQTLPLRTGCTKAPLCKRPVQCNPNLNEAYRSDLLYSFSGLSSEKEKSLGSAVWVVISREIHIKEDFEVKQLR